MNQTPNCTRLLQSSPNLKNSLLDYASNSGDKEDNANDMMPNIGSSMKFFNKRKYLLTEFNATENPNNRSYSYFNGKYPTLSHL